MNNPEIDSAGNKYWRNDRWQFHCDHGPAIEYINGSKIWYLHGKCHREDGPAFDDSGYKAWYINGQLHRIHGPAIEYSNGQVEYYIYGNRYDSLAEGLMNLALE